MPFERPSRFGKWGWLLVLGLLAAACGGTGPAVPAAPPTQPPLQMAQFENPASFDLLYPASWTYNVIGEGLMAFGDERTTTGRAVGQTLTVFRVSPGKVRGSLADMLDHYLENGPFREGFTVEKETLDSVLDGRPALETLLRAEKTGSRPALKAYVAATGTAGGAVYIFTAVVPAAEWEASKEQMVVMVHSVAFNE